MLWQPDALRHAVNGAMPVPFAADGVSIDTRTLRPGDLFVALVGERDGHAHAAAAIAAGAAGIMAHQDGLPGPVLRVADTQMGLRVLGAAGRARFCGRAVGVTGSVGKTTAKEMLRAILAPQGRTHAAEASYNNHWGVPLTLARLPQDAAFLVAEIGMNHPGEIAPLARLVQPHVALVTSVEAAHIGHMGSLEAIADEKASIAVGLAPGGTAILPGDHPLLTRMLAACARARVLRFGVDPACDAALLDCVPDAEGSAVRARVLGQEIGFRLGAPGRHMAMNAVAALLAAAALGAAPDPAPLAAFRPVAGRGLARPILAGRAILLDESYNASPASVRAALSVLAIQPARRRLAVLGDMREMGEHGPAGHADLAPAVLANADLLYCCGSLCRHLHEALPPERRGGHAPDAETLAPLVARAARPGDAVLVKGSLGSRMRLVVEALGAL